MFWYPKYLQAARGVDAVRSGDFASIVLAAGSISSVLGGVIGDYAMRRTGGMKRTRSYIGSFACGSSALAVLAALFCESAMASTLWIALAFFLMQLHIANWWSAIADVSGKHVATIFALSNSVGLLGGVGSQLFFGWMADVRAAQGFTGRAQWDPAIYYVVALLVVASVSWFIVNSNRSAVEDTETRGFEVA
jgi:MFS transporter, ACS family, glucarate transporter